MALDTTAKHYGAMNFGAPFLVSLTLPEANDLDTELERTSFLRLSPDIDPSASGGGAGNARAYRINLSLSLGLT